MLFRHLPKEAKLGCRKMLADPWRFSPTYRRVQPRREILNQGLDENRRQLFKIPRVGRAADDDTEFSFSSLPSSSSSLFSSSSFLPKQSSSFPSVSASSLLSPYSLQASQSAPSSDYLAPSHSSPPSSDESSLNEDQIKEMIFGAGTRSQRNIQTKIPRVGRSQMKAEEEILL